MKSPAPVQERAKLEETTENQITEVRRRAENEQKCPHARLVWPVGWPGNLVQCVACGKWIAV